MDGYVLAQSNLDGVTYKAVVSNDSLILYIEKVPIKKVDAWHYDRKSAKMLLHLELAQSHLGRLSKIFN